LLKATSSERISDKLRDNQLVSLALGLWSAVSTGTISSVQRGQRDSADAFYN
jgi:hypothetical protein